MGWFDDASDRETFLKLLSPNPTDKILDVGAGKGNIATIVQSTGSSEVYALDPNTRRIAFIQKERANLKACLSDSESMPFPNQFFDKVYSTMAVHHFRDQRKSFREFARVLKPWGTLLVVEMSPYGLGGKLARLFENGILRSHLKFLDHDELAEMLKHDGEFEVKEARKHAAIYFLQAIRTTAK